MTGAPDIAPMATRPERGIDAASPFANPRANRFVHAARTLKRPEGRAPGGSVDALFDAFYLDGYSFNGTFIRSGTVM